MFNRSQMIIKRADRLIARTIIGTLLIVWLVLVGFDVLDQLARQLRYVGQHGYTFNDALAFIALTLPRRMYQHFGSASLIGGLLGLGGLAASGELTALRAAGMSKLRVAASVVMAVGMLTALVMLMGETIAPIGDQTAQTMQMRARFGQVGLSNSGGLWTRAGNTIVNARKALAIRHNGIPSVRFSDVRIFTLTPDGQVTRFVRARNANHGPSGWILHDVRITLLQKNALHVSTVDRMPWHTQINTKVLKQSVVHPDYLSMRDLLRNMHYLKANGLSPGVYANVFWKHVVYPLNVLALVLCAMPFAFGSLRSGGLGRRLFVGVLLAIGWYFLQRVVTNTAVVYGFSPLISNMVPALVLLAGGGFYFKRYN